MKINIEVRFSDEFIKAFGGCSENNSTLIWMDEMTPFTQEQMDFLLSRWINQMVRDIEKAS